MKHLIAAVALFLAFSSQAQTCTPSTSPPLSAVSVRTFGAFPDDGIDDTAALQRALDGGGTLVMPPGQYLMNSQIYMRKISTYLYGPGATLHATNPESMSITIEADFTGVYGLRFTAVTTTRLSAPRHARIAVYKEIAGVKQIVRSVSIVGNVIAPIDGSVDKNSASAGGIMLLRAVNFLVSGNTVVRTLSDGIHITGGSRDGRVVGNTVRENGDDMIAVVSYASSGEPALNTAADLRANWADRVNNRLVQNILISGNNLSAQYWGRGITVIGGRDVTIDSNVIDNTPLGAAILIAREGGYQTFGPRNVRVTNNAITRNQTARSPYDPDGSFATRPRTGHGPIEVHSSIFEDEAADATLRTELAVRDLAFLNNSIKTSATAAMRVGVESTGSRSAIGPGGITVTRRLVTGDVVNLDVGAATGVTGSSLRCYSQ